MLLMFVDKIYVYNILIIFYLIKQYIYNIVYTLFILLLLLHVYAFTFGSHKFSEEWVQTDNQGFTYIDTNTHN